MLGEVSDGKDSDMCPTGKQNFMDALREQYEGGFKIVSVTRTKHREPGM